MNSDLIFIFIMIGAAVAAIGPIVAPVLRSMTSKVVPINERGTSLMIFKIKKIFDRQINYIHFE